MHVSWYTKSRYAIWLVLEELPADADKATIDKAIFEAYPFGQRRYLPYKMWLKAKGQLLHQRFPKIYPTPRAKINKVTERKLDEQLDRQPRLF